MKFGVGQPVPRVEDQRLLTGRGNYGDDLNAPNAAVGYFLRSPHAHAQIRDIDLTAARDLPGVVAIYTGHDIAAAGLGHLPCPISDFVPLKRPDGTPFFLPPRSAIAPEFVRHVGDIVAMIVAESAALAQDAAETIFVDYETLPAVCAPALAAKMDAPPVWPDCPDNLAYLHQIGDADAVNSAFAAAHNVVEFDWRNSRVAPTPMEPRTALGEYDPHADRYRLTSGTQAPHDMRFLLAQKILGIPEHKLQIISPDMGGAFGGRITTYPEMVLVLWAARQTERAVKWVADRSEGFLADDGARDSNYNVALALNQAGDFLALRVKNIAALGAYFSLFGPFPTFMNAGGIAGVYRLPAISCEVSGVLTNTPPTGPYRGAGRPEASFCIEMAIDLAARKFGYDRVELRRRNLIAPSDIPYQTALTYNYDSGDFQTILDKSLILADVAGFEERRRQSEARGRVRGLGIAYAIEQTAGHLDESVDIRVDRSGDVTLSVGTHSHGQGHETSYRQVLAEKLAIDPMSIHFVQGDTDQITYGHGSFGSRSMGLGSAAILKSADRIIDKAKQIAAHQLEVAVQDLEYSEGSFTITGTDKALSWAAVAKLAFVPQMLPSDMETGLAAHAGFTPSAPTYPNGSHVAEVEIDPETGALTLERYAVVDDVGTVINPLLVKGQIHGGVVQGLGQVFGENVVYDEQSGQLLTGSFMDYNMPRAAAVPAIQVESHPVPTPINPLGVKGAGEAGTIGALPCLQSAILDALAPLGVTWLDMPATPHRIWQAIEHSK